MSFSSSHTTLIYGDGTLFPFAGGPGGGVFFARASAGLAWLARASLAVVVLEIDEPAAPRILKHVPMAGFTHDIVTVCRKDSQVVNAS